MAKTKKSKNKRIPLRYKKPLKSKRSGQEEDKCITVEERSTNIRTNIEKQDTLSTCDVRSVAKSLKSSGTWNSLTKKAKQAIRHKHFQQRIDSVYMNTNEDRPKGRVTIKQQNKKIHSVAEDPTLPTETVGIDYLLQSKGSHSSNKAQHTNKKRKGATLKIRQATINRDLHTFKKILQNESYKNNSVEMITDNILDCIRKETLNK